MTPTLYVAEIGSMHEGNLALACELVRQARDAGASIAKFQFGWPQEDKLRGFSDDFVKRIAAYCEHVGIELMASIWSEDGLRQAKMVNMLSYKIAHQKKDDGALIAKVLSEHRKTYVSGGDWSELTVPIFCVSKYPTYPEELQMPARLGHDLGWYGYSDHCHGIGACLLAVARGALYIEKHFTLNKASQSVRDNAFSSTPAEFAELTRLGREIERVRNAMPV